MTNKTLEKLVEISNEVDNFTNKIENELKNLPDSKLISSLLSINAFFYRDFVKSVDRAVEISNKYKKEMKHD